MARSQKKAKDRPLELDGANEQSAGVSYPENDELEVVQPAPRRYRKTKANALDQAIWMTPAAGCPKGAGAAKAAMAHKRALSDIKDIQHSKKPKGEESSFLPEPSFDSDEDIEMTEPTVSVTKAPRLATSASSSRKSKVPVGNVTAAPKPVNPKATPAKLKGSVKAVVATPGPARLNVPSSDEDEESGSDEGTQEEDELNESSESDGNLSDTAFAFTLAKITGDVAAPMQSADNLFANDHAVTVVPRSTPMINEISDETTSIPISKTKKAEGRSKKPEPKKLSKRLEAHNAEQPQILAVAPVPTTRAWSVAATPVRGSGGEYILTVQPPTLRSIIKLSFPLVLEYVVFKNVYPKYDHPADFMKNILMKAASIVGKQSASDPVKNTKAREIFDRFKMDPSFVKCFADLGTTRLCQFRSASKTVAHTIASAHYGLTTLTESEQRKMATDELHKDRFILARRKNGNVLKSAPYLHLAIMVTVRDWAFKSHTTFGPVCLRFIPKFTTSLPDDDEQMEKEITIPIVAAAVTAVQSILIDVANTGSTLTKGRFDSDILAPYYRGHALQLAEMQQKHPQDFHRIMSELYRFATGQAINDVKKAAGNFDFDDHESEEGEAATFDDFEDLTGHEPADGEGDIEVAGVDQSAAEGPTA
ncbi:hypothetical protein VNI00_016225 [Paramarasmius palmivorus]|uniref:DUF6532 domain-containing protein n=1 Tax=Paramarasmius palmivorus TaxID=297713 RepID=A0AAW0BDX4_9AGAR